MTTTDIGDAGSGHIIRNVQHLPDVEWRDGQVEMAAGARERGSSDFPEFPGCVRSPYGALPVFGVDGADERRHEEAEQRERQRMTNEIEQDEPSAGPAHIANQGRQAALGKVVSEMHGKGHIRVRQ